MSDTTIEWTQRPGTRGRTWNTTRGCLRTSPGCGGGKVEGAGDRQGGCYAERMAYRFAGPGQPYEGLVRMTAHGPRWTGEGRFVSEMLRAPLGWREPSTVFVNSMSDLFFEAFSDDEIAAVFGVMAACPQHTFIVLTKRAARMRQWFERASANGRDPLEWVVNCADEHYALRGRLVTHGVWPLPNVWLGVSCERQAEADERMDDLIATPSAVRIVSAEPLLRPIDFARWVTGFAPMRGLHQIIVGGESGPGARPCDVEWVRSIVRQCRAVGLPVFVKQLGALPRIPNDPNDEPDVLMSALALRSRKGSDMAEWPEDLRVREWPRVEGAL